MIISLNLLKTFLNIDVDRDSLADALTMLGHEVESIKKYELDNVVIGELKSVVKHPNADKLTLCRVDIGREVQIVCGAKNHREGDRVVVALNNALIPCGLKVVDREIRGILSQGMLCSAEELGLEDKSDGILILDSGEKGTNFFEHIFNNDTIFDLEITPNRPDCLSHLGIVRELSAYYKKDISFPNTIEFNKKTNLDIPREGSLSYRGVILRDVEIKESPQWLKTYLSSFGIKSINNLVDISNYVMMELGHPSHMFDLDKLEGNLSVRYATKDEKVLGLDEKEYSLDSKDLVIADSKKAVAIAGIMGSLNSGISNKTTNVLLEVAHFDEKIVRRTSKKLNLSTEASYRFERGIDILDSQRVIERIIYLVKELSSFSSFEEIINSEDSCELKTISIDIDEMNSFLGSNISKKEVVDILTSLKLSPEIDGNIVTSKVPSYRLDLSREVDIYEEVARIYGYINILPKMPKVDIKPMNSESVILKEKIRSKLLSLGLQETVNYSFVPKGWGKLELSNPLNEDFAVMRDSFIYSMLKNVSFNLNNGSKNIEIFEIGKIYSENREEFDRIAIALSGQIDKSLWNDKEELDFFNLKGIIESLSQSLNWDISFSKGTKEEFHPGKFANILHNDKEVGFMGEIHPLTLKKFGIKKRVYLLEMNILQNIDRKIEEISKYPIVERELGLLCPKDIEIGSLISDILKDNLIISGEVVDIYEGEQVPKGMKSVALKFSFQDRDKTLKDSEIEEIVNKILETSKELYNSELRLS